MPLLMEPEGPLPCSQEPANGLMQSQLNPVHTPTSYTWDPF